jgi:hypothetical protein
MVIGQRPRAQVPLLVDEEILGIAKEHYDILVPPGTPLTQMPAPHPLYLGFEFFCPCQVQKKSLLIVPKRQHENAQKVTRMRATRCDADGVDFMLWVGQCPKCAKVFYSFLNMLVLKHGKGEVPDGAADPDGIGSGRRPGVGGEGPARPAEARSEGNGGGAAGGDGLGRRDEDSFEGE